MHSGSHAPWPFQLLARRPIAIVDARVGSELSVVNVIMGHLTAIDDLWATMARLLLSVWRDRAPFSCVL